MKKIIFILYFIPTILYARSINLYKDIDLNYNGYVGYKFVTSSIENNLHNSEPELGLILSTQINDNFSLYTQFAYDSNTVFNALKYSFASFDKKINEDFEIGIKAGKLRHNYASFNEYRVSPRTRQGIIMPQAIYWDVLRYLLTSGTGVNITFKFFDQLELGYTIDDPETFDPEKEAEAWSKTVYNSIETSFGSHQLAYAKYQFKEIPLWIRATWTYLDLGQNITNIAKRISPTGRNMPGELFTLGFQYSPDNWTFSGEALAVKPSISEWNIDNTTFGFSTSIKYDFENNFRIYTNYNRYFTDPSFNPHRPSYIKETHDASIGVSYEYENWLLGVEYHHIIGGRWLDPNDIKTEQDNLNSWHMIAANIVYFF